MTPTTTRKAEKGTAGSLRSRVIRFWDAVLKGFEVELDAREGSSDVVDVEFIKAAKIMSDQVRLDVAVDGSVSETAEDPEEIEEKTLARLNLKIAS